MPLIRAEVWRWVALALALALVALGVTYKVHVGALNLTINQQATKLSELTTENAKLRRDVEVLGDSIDRQNIKIYELEAAQKEASEAADRAIKEAMDQAAKWRKSYQNLLNQPRPSSDECTATKVLVEQYFKLREEQ